ncbi:hypothetical protein Tco_0798972 [Tanacetum coccineum]
MFTMTSFGAKIDESINAGRGPYVFKVSGQIYHWIGSLCLPPGEAPRFLQLYIYDNDNEVENRMRHFDGIHNNDLDPQMVEGLIHFLDAYTELVQLFRTTRDKCRELDIPEFKYLKGTPSLGLWYPNCSSFILKGYLDSDYSAKKKQYVAMSLAKVEYVVAAGCCANILWMKSQLTDYDIIYEKIRLSSSLKKLPSPPTMKAPTQNKEYLSEFWYTAKTLDNSKIWVSTPIGEIKGDIGGKTGGLDQISNKDATIMYCLANRVKVDYARLIWEDIIHKLSKKTREKVVPYLRFISLLLEYMMPEYENEELIINPTQMCMWTPKLLNLPHKLRRFPKAKSLELKVDSEENNLLNKHLSPRLRHPNPKLANQKKKLSPVQPRINAQAILHLPHQWLVICIKSFFHLYSESGSRHDASADYTAEADPGLSAHNDFIPSQQGLNPSVLVDQTKSDGDRLETAHTNSGTNEESRADDISKKIKLEDLSDLLKDT